MKIVKETELKSCKRCSKLAEFYSKRSICKSCYKKEHREYNRKYYKDNAVARKSYMKKYREENPEKVKEIVDNYYKSPRGKFKIYKKTARERGIEWKLTFDEFMTFWNQPCYYTGKPIDTIGLDRIDSSIGYEMGNVVSCLKKVNWAKNDMPQVEFLEMCIDIVKNLGLITEK